MGEFPNPSENIKKKIKDVLPTNFGRNTLIKSREQINEIVEEPLLLACQILYDKNIKTVDSTANAKNLREGIGCAGIAIEYDSFSEENRKIAEALGLIPQAYDDFQVIEITVPMSTESSVEKISSAAQEIARKFVVQAPNWLPRYKIDELKNGYGIAETEEVPLQDFIDEGYFYDSQTETFYESEDHFNKVKKWEEDHPES